MPHTQHSPQISAKARKIATQALSNTAPTRSKQHDSEHLQSERSQHTYIPTTSQTVRQSATVLQSAPEPWRSARYTAEILKISRETVKSLFEDNIIRTAPKGKRLVTTDSWIAEYQERMFHINERKTRVQHERLLPPVIVVLGSEGDASSALSTHHNSQR